MRRQARAVAWDVMSTKILDVGRVEDDAGHLGETWQRYWDDISGKELVGDLVKAAREEELKVVDEMKVWELRPISEFFCRDRQEADKG